MIVRRRKRRRRIVKKKKDVYGGTVGLRRMSLLREQVVEFGRD